MGVCSCEAEDDVYQIPSFEQDKPQRATMECVACMEPTESTVVPCGHPICDRCAHRWMDMGKRTCPTCRQPFITLSSFGIDPPERGERIVTMCFEEEKVDHVGITLGTETTSSRVVVRRVERADMAYRHGIRPKQLITRINSIKVSDHQTAIAVIDAAREASIPLTLYVRPPRRFSDVFRDLMNVVRRHTPVRIV